MINWNAIFSYDPKSPTGIIWSVDRYGANGRVAAKAGSIAGTPHSSGKGYGSVRFQGKGYLTHRIIWEMHFGPIPDGMEVDHEDGRAGSMSVSNMRLVTPQVNARNKVKYANNTSGYTGVFWSCTRNLAVARWSDLGGRQRSKVFHVGVDGKEAALLVAKAYRDSQLRTINALGAGYTERHINGNT